MNLVLKRILQLFYHKDFRVVKVNLLEDTNNIQEIQLRTLVNEIAKTGVIMKKMN